MRNLYELQGILRESHLLDRKMPLRTRYADVIQDERVREILDLEIPPITDLTGVLGIENGGRVYAVRMDLNRGADNHKKPVVAGLILRGVLQGRIPKEGINTFIDGGIFKCVNPLFWDS